MTNERRKYDLTNRKDRLEVYERVRRLSAERGDHETARYYQELIRDDGKACPPTLPKQVPISRPRVDTEAARREAADAIDALTGHTESWQSALARWGLPLSAIAQGDPTCDHRLAEAFWSGGSPDKWTRAEARAAHAAWQRKASRAAKEREARRQAGLASQGLTEGDVTKEEAALVAQAKEERRDADLYVECASRVLSAWRDKGADMRGVRFDENGLLKPTSKGVRWFRSVTDGKPPKHVREASRRLAEKQRGWRQDFEAFRRFK